MNWYSVVRLSLAGIFVIFMFIIAPVSPEVMFFFGGMYLVLDYILLCIFMEIERRETMDATKKVLRDRG